MSDDARNEMAALKSRLAAAEATNTHLREQLFALHAQRVRMEGYLYKYKPYGVSFFSSSWERRYFSLVDTCLKSFPSEQSVALIPESETHVPGYTLHWEGKKRHRFWTFGLKDASGCVVVRLSTTDRSTALKWISALEAAGADDAARRLPRMSSLPLERRSTEAHDVPSVERELPEFVAAPRAQHRARRSMVGSTPVHTASRASILSSERLFQHPHPGILNLGTVILFAANFRLVLENVFKYGLRFNPLRWVELLLWGSSQPLMLCWPVLGVCAFQAYLIERLAAQFVRHHESQQKRRDDGRDKFRREPLIVTLHILNVTLCLGVPLWLVYLSIDAVLPSFVLTFVTLIVCMKLISYAHCNADLRRQRVEPTDDAPLSYPSNVAPKDMAYFLFAPTLTYQTGYPRSDRIRGKWLMRRCGELALALALQLAIIDQYIAPAVENSMVPLEKRDFVHLVERVLKLSLPVLYAWLTMFYIFFHLWLNILAEALRFADREFYLDWWNALSLGDYWKTWNTPVHKWMLRTIYYPAIHLGLQRSAAMLLVFFVSALMHEVVIMVPLKFSSRFPWSFVSMLGQVPLIFFSQFLQKKFGDRWGNIIFWVSFCVVGQPICLLNYYYDWIHAVHLS